MSTGSRTPSLTPSRSPSPEPLVQPDHFFGIENTQFPPSPHSDGKTWLDPKDDPLAHRGIPVFKPTMEEFQDFEAYVMRVECWGERSGIVKIIPPKEWTDALPPLVEQLKTVKIRTPIEQHMLGSGGLFRQENMEKRKIMSVREWAELCSKDEFRAPGVRDIGPHARSANTQPRTRRAESVGPVPDEMGIKEEPTDSDHAMVDANSDSISVLTGSPAPQEITPDGSAKPKVKGKRVSQTRQAREASLADRASRDAVFLETFEPHKDWLPPNTQATDYTPEFCQKLERQYWRNCGLGRSAWYGADTQGSLYTDETTSWNVAHLPSTLSRLLPSSDQGLPGVNTPYLYFGMWRATFAWHVEDMDLFSINYIHFGAPKFWYAIPQGRAGAMEQTMRGYFPKDTSQCPQFLRHKSFLASPTLLAQSSCRPNYLVQHSGEFVITFPRGYHAGFNLGFNCAESLVGVGKRAKACECVTDSTTQPQTFTQSKKRKSEESGEAPLPKNPIRCTPLPKLSVTLKLGPRPAEPDQYPCCLCISMSTEGLLKVHDPPLGRKDAVWMAHENCANVVPETWVDELDEKTEAPRKRWNLKCSACTKTRPRAHGAPIQCTKGKCPKAFHVSCAKDGANNGIIFNILREVEKEVVLLDSNPIPPAAEQMEVDHKHSVGSGEINAPVSSEPPARVLKVIKKLDVQVLCTHITPYEVAAAKKASKQDKVKNDLLALPGMARIKIRVSAGVFEVSLIRVIEETSSVEVLWDRGLKREFKWGSVVFGNTDGPVQQKPSELAPEPEQLRAVLPVATYPSAAAATNHTSAGPSQGYAAPGISTKRYATTTQYLYPPRTTPYDYWPYQSYGTQPPYASTQPTHPYSYSQYYPTPGTPHYAAYAYNQAHYSKGQLHWQQPYQGPQPGAAGVALPQASQPSEAAADPPAAEQSSKQQPASDSANNKVITASVVTTNPLPVAPVATDPPPVVDTPLPETLVNNLAVLSSLQPSQIADVLRDNPRLRDIVWAAVDKARKANDIQT
ncbi:JmjC domain, hydroxylase-domain-containing protein [Infundibulicybe gibba]|nr:JmjC domain, hydroxylase-domain-containing protein [Infundibulicybe gibba]